MKTYHDADKFFERRINILKDKSYREINEIFCDFYCNWLSEFYLKLKDGLNCEIIFPNNIQLIKNNLDCKKTKKNYLDYLNYIIEDYKPDYVVTNTENYNYIYNLNKENSYKILWKSSKISKKENEIIKKNFNHILSDNDDILKTAKLNRIKSTFLLISIPDRILNYKEHHLREKKIFFTGSLGNDYDNRRNILEFIISNKIELEIRSRDIKEYKNYFEKFLIFF